MPEHDELSVAFAYLEESAMPEIRLAGLDQVHATVRRRRIARTVATSVAALVLVVSIAVVAVVRGTGGGPDVVATDPPAPTSSGTPITLFTTPDPAGKLADARIDLPDFGHEFCPKGQTQFAHGAWSGPGVPDVFSAQAWIEQVLDQPIGPNRTAATIARITCNAGTDPGAYAAQVVAVGPTGAVLGQVIRVSGGVKHLADVEVATDGTVRVLVTDTPNGSTPEAFVWHSFTWTGSTFAASGTTPQTVDLTPTRLTITATPVHLTGRKGTVTVRITNQGPPSPVRLNVGLNSTLPLLVGPTPKLRCRSAGGTTAACDYGLTPFIGESPVYYLMLQLAPVATGTTVEGTFEVVLDDSATVGSGTLDFVVSGVSIADYGPDNVDAANQVQVAVSSS